ncbi:MAG: Nif3-like dinuclear metal center hexameric protein [Ruminococcaceae bacterium]|nr:Nif3-like dinuclear metal center hexameric protein [Oscillospiraceae bacterium]MBR2934335.1 Nif3-like dinuclear metal center hexameric protein [Oscillospiraceae bacterium]
MAQVKDIYQYIDSIAPFATQLDFDNAGLLVGRADAAVATVLVALDITADVIREAVDMGAQLIVAHHPVIFHPLKSITDGDTTGEKALLLAEHRIAAICAHTNLDAAQDGVNDLLAQRLGLNEIEQLHQDGVDGQGRAYGIGRVGVLDANTPMDVASFAAKVKADLNAVNVRYMDTGKPVCKVAVGGGSCGSMLADTLAAGCDTFVTADVKYDVFLEAKALGINLLDAGHFATENVVVVPLADRVRKAFPQLNVVVSKVHREVFASI